MPPVLILFALAGAILALVATAAIRAAGRQVGMRGNLAIPSGRPRFFVTARRAQPTRNLRSR